MAAVETLRPQEGPQRAFMESEADLVIFGGAAGGGKSHGLLLEAARYVDRRGFRGVVFRRTSPQITAGGGLWDASGAIYPRVRAKANISAREWRFPRGGRLAFRHLQHESDIYDWQGAELAFIGWDELTHFTERQFFYLLSRNRTTCGIRPYVRATCNPDAGSWVKAFLQWWIDPVTGYPDPDRIGVLRWFYRVEDELNWYGSREEAEAAHPDLAVDSSPLSVTFIPAKLSDNAILCAKDPGYRAKLKALSWVERARLLDGNWNATASDGLFRAEWFPPAVEESALPAVWKQTVRAWDLAATEQKDSNDPDWLAGVKMGKDGEGRYWVRDVKRFRISPLKVKNTIKATAEEDGKDVEIVIEQEPGSAGAVLAAELKSEFTAAGFRCYIFRPDKTTGDKVTRAYPFSAECERKNVYLARGPWLKSWLGELTQFPTKGVHDDMTDASCVAYRRLRGGFVFA